MKSVVRIFIAVAVLVLAYVAAAWAIGRVVVAETAKVAAELALHDGVTVRRLDYEAGVFGGLLRYDLGYRPAPDSALDEVLPAVRHLRGEMALRHGPWVGDGFALAAGDGAVAMPPGLRAALPDLPPDAALLGLRLRHAFDRSLRLDFDGFEYDGRVAALEPGGDDGHMRLTDARGWVEFDPALSWMRFDVALGRWHFDGTEPEPVRLGVQDMAASGDVRREGERFWSGSTELRLGELDGAGRDLDFRLAGLAGRMEASMRPGGDGDARPALRTEVSLGSAALDGRGTKPAMLQLGELRGDADMIEEWPHVWTGRSTLILRDLALGDTQPRLRSESLTLRADAARRGAVYDQSTALDVGPTRFRDTHVGGGGLTLSLRGIDGDALSDLLQVVERHWQEPPEADETELRRALQAAGQRIMAGRPELSLDRIALTVLRDNDLAARAAIVFDGAPGLAPTDFSAWMERTELSAGLVARLDAVQELIRLITEAEAVAAAAGGAPPDAAAIAREASARYFAFVTAATRSPLLVLGPEELRSEIAYARGGFTVNGVDADPMELLGAMAAIDLPGSGSRARTQAPVIDAPPHFARLSLLAGFRPDPRSVRLSAGGPDLLDAELGPECFGHIHRTRPDVTLDYAAGSAPLHLSVSSSADTALIVHAPDGRWHCNDDRDAASVDPLLAFPRPSSGNYRIWVANLATGRADAVLSISEGKVAR